MSEVNGGGLKSWFDLTDYRTFNITISLIPKQLMKQI